ncbi:MAG: tetratricopeptide repeat protein [Candidatus Omnitrophica bacterium]|nr:tetratricopeptide repeat protein [Candidatus Omnitrophota bacterium]
MSLRKLAPFLLLLGASLIAYAHSFHVPFLFDDGPSILDNPYIRQLWPPWVTLLPPPSAPEAWRPVVSLSLAINYAINEFSPRGYHILNWAVHTGVGWALFVWLRSVFGLPRLARLNERAADLALAIALLWIVHPLLTQSVTYIIQRAECMMALFYVLTLYSVARSAKSPGSRAWMWAAIVFCGLGMLTKRIMVTAPVMALVYDRLFLAESWKELWNKRRALYLGLCATWAPMLLLMWMSPEAAHPGYGFGMAELNALDYAASQPAVILHYIRLVIWPSPLVFDYAWPVAKTTAEILPYAIAILILLALTIFGLLRRHPAAFLGFWFFGLLAPSSSFVPIADLAAEHRMYLPSVALITGVVLALDYFAQRKAFWTAVLLLCIPLTILTLDRNRDYRSAEAIWKDTVTKRPLNPHAQYNYGSVLSAQGRLDEALPYLFEALRLDPTYADVNNNIGAVLGQQGRLDEAEPYFLRALEINPDFADARRNLLLLKQLEKP